MGRVNRSLAEDYEMKAIEHPTKAHVVVVFGMLGYRVLFEHDDEQVCREELDYILAKPDRMKEAARGYTRNPHKHDFDVRTPADLDALTKAILRSYS